MRRRNAQLISALLLTFLFLAGQGVPLHRAAQKKPAAAAALLLAAVCLTAAPAVRRFFQRAWQAVCRMPRGAFNLLVFVAALGAYSAVAWFTFGGIPRIDDGMAALFQARIFASGAFRLPVPPNAEFFTVFGVLSPEYGVNHWCGMYPVGWPALLVPGVWLGAPWLINPVLGALLVVAIGELGRLFYSPRVGRLAALLALPSPFLLVLSGLHLSHIATTLSLCLALICLRKLRLENRAFWGAGAGLCWSAALFCRPADAALLGALFALSFCLPPKNLWRCRTGILSGLAVALVMIGLYFWAQGMTTGDWHTPGHALGLQEIGRFGFGEFNHRITHTPAKGIQMTFWRLRALNENLLGWILPSLLLVMLPFLFGRARLKEGLFLLPMTGLLLLYLFFWYYEEYFPARYISAAIPYLFVLAALGLFRLHAAVRTRPLLSRLPLFLLLFGALSMPITQRFHFKNYDQRFGDVEDLLPRVIRDCGIQNAIVFMDSVGLETSGYDDDNDFYATGFMRNDLALTNSVLYARNRRAHNRQLMDAHPDRDAYLYRYHRGAQKALLYRIHRTPDGTELEPFPAITPDLLPAAAP